VVLIIISCYEVGESESEPCEFIELRSLLPQVASRTGVCIVHVIKSNRVKGAFAEGKVGVLLPSNPQTLVGDRLGFVVLRKCGLTVLPNPFSYHYCTVTTCKK
jgi:hypothetical protein